MQKLPTKFLLLILRGALQAAALLQLGLGRRVCQLDCTVCVTLVRTALAVSHHICSLHACTLRKCHGASKDACMQYDLQRITSCCCGWLMFACRWLSSAYPHHCWRREGAAAGKAHLTRQLLSC